jgi:hypothetical protein
MAPSDYIICFSVWTNQGGQSCSFAAAAKAYLWSESVLYFLYYSSELYVMNLCLIVIKYVLF